MPSEPDVHAAAAATGRYSSLAQALHWIIAVLILLNLLLGWRMGLMHGLTKFQVFQLHKSFGITVLVLSLARLAWRLAHKPPALPPGLHPAEVAAAKVTHWAFYGLMIGLPLSGWILVSASAENLPTLLYRVLPWPYVPFVHGLPPALRHGAGKTASVVHYWLAWCAVALIGLHVLGALKHQLRVDERILPRMLPGLHRRRGAAPILASLAILASVCGAGLLGLQAIAGRKPLQAATLVPLPAPAPIGPVASKWEVDKPLSTLRFRATVNGQVVEGGFGNWTSSIRFDPKHLDQANVEVLVDTGSARTGDSTRDEMLPAADWFDHSIYPQADFHAGRIVSLGSDRFEADGILKIRSARVPVRLPFTLVIDGDDARMDGSLPIDRTAFGVGQGQWGGTDSVAATVIVDIKLTAHLRH